MWPPKQSQHWPLCCWITRTLYKHARPTQTARKCCRSRSPQNDLTRWFSWSPQIPSQHGEIGSHPDVSRGSSVMGPASGKPRHRRVGGGLCPGSMPCRWSQAHSGQGRQRVFTSTGGVHGAASVSRSRGRPGRAPCDRAAIDARSRLADETQAQPAVLVQPAHWWLWGPVVRDRGRRTPLHVGIPGTTLEPSHGLNVQRRHHRVGGIHRQ